MAPKGTYKAYRGAVVDRGCGHRDGTLRTQHEFVQACPAPPQISELRRLVNRDDAELMAVEAQVTVGRAIDQGALGR